MAVPIRFRGNIRVTMPSIMNRFQAGLGIIEMLYLKNDYFNNSSNKTIWISHDINLSFLSYFQNENNKLVEVIHSFKLLFIFHAVLNFFPVPVQEECLSQDKRRRGICMNTYECRMQRGKSHGRCALGFGVCCICKYNLLFTNSCNVWTFHKFHGGNF